MVVASGLLKAFDRGNIGRDKSTEGAFLRAAARACGWRFYDIEECLIPRSYAWARVEHWNETTFILLHDRGAAAAFAATGDPAECWNFRYVDRPDFVKAAADLEIPIRFLSAAELAHELTSDDRAFIAGLDSSMAYDVRYWNPQTVSHVLFNFWD